MGDSIISKKVLFIGAWRSQSISDQLLRQLSSNMSSKKSYTTNLKLTTEGLELRIYDKSGKITRHDQIPLENLVDFIDNKYNTLCVLVIVREKQQQTYTVFGFVCGSDRDAAEMIHGFRSFKNQLSGEGYNLDVTSKGQNWTLVTNGQVNRNDDVKSPVNKQNGDVRIIKVGHSGGNTAYVQRKSSDTNESVKSKTEMKEELSQLAGEIRDIKRVIQQSKGRQQFQNHYQYLTSNKIDAQPVVHTEPQHKHEEDYERRRALHMSTGRHQFEKHYGYRILQSPTAVQTLQQTQTVRTDAPDTVVMSPPPPQIKRQTVYQKKSKPKNGSTMFKHVVAVAPPDNTSVIKGSRRYVLSTSSSVPASNASSASVVSKRVYDSANPLLELQSPPQQRKNYTLVATNRSHRFRHRSPVRKTFSYGSGIVQRNIEDVYKTGGRSRMMRRIIVPPPTVSPSVTEYVNVQSTNGSTSPVQQAYEDQRQVTYIEDVVNDEPLQVRGVYESRDDVTGVNTSTMSNVSTTVNTSVDDGLDDNYLLRGEDMNDRESTAVERDGNVIIIRADTEMTYRQAPNHIDTEIVHVKGDVVQHTRYEEPETIGGEVYHVKAQSLREYERQGDTSGMIVISENDYTRGEDNTTETIRDENVSTVHSSIVINGNGADGLLGGYTRKPDNVYDENTTLVEEKSYRYHDGSARVVVTNDGLFGAYTKKPDEVYDDNTTLVEKRAYRYHDDEAGARNSGNESPTSDNNIHFIQSNTNGDASQVRRVHYNDDDEHIVDTLDTDNTANTDVDSKGRVKRMTSVELRQKMETWNNKTNDENEEPYKMDTDALRRSMQEPDLVIIDSDSNRNTEYSKSKKKGKKSSSIGKFGLAAAGGAVVTAAVAGGSAIPGMLNNDAVSDMANQSEIGSNVMPAARQILDNDTITDISSPSDLTSNALPIAQDALGTDAVANFANESEIGQNVLPAAKGLLNDGEFPSTSDIGDKAIPMASEALDTDAVTNFAAESDIGSTALPVAKDFLQTDSTGDLPSASDLGDKALPMASEALDTDAVTDFAAESDIGSTALPVAKDFLQTETTGDLPSASDFGDKALPMAREAIDTDAVTDFAAESDIGSKAMPAAKQLLDNDTVEGLSTSNIGEKAVPLAKEALGTDAIGDFAAKSDIGGKAVPLAQRYLDEDAIKQITSRSEETVLF